MATIITRAGKGSPLENAEVDANFTNLNDDKLEATDLSVSTGAASGGGTLSYSAGVFTFAPADLSSYITDLSSFTTTDLTEGTNLYYTNERVDDRVSTLIVPGLGITTDYDDTAGTLTIDSDTIEELCKNGTGSTILKGTPVYQTGTAGNAMVIAPADASSAATMPAVGVLSQDLAAAAEGSLILMGRISGIDTSAFSEGDVIYVASGGGYTNTRPTGESVLVQNLGRVTKVHASNGGGVVMGSGRANDVPNLTDGNIFIGNASGTYDKRAIVTADISDLTATATELNYTDGVTSSIQTQLNTKAPTASPTFTGTVTADGLTVNGAAVFNEGGGDNDFRVESDTNTHALFLEGSSGNVGIGTSSPTASLDIRSPNTAVQSRGNLYVTTTSTAAINEGGQISLGGTYTGATETFFGAIAARKENATVGDFNAYLQLSVRNTGGMSEKMRIDSSGNVGIGTSSPAAFTGFTANRKTLQIVNTTSGNGQLRLGTDAGLMVDHDGGGTTASTIRNLYGATNAAASLALQSGIITLGTGTSYTERMRIDASGNVGIGTSSVSGVGNYKVLQIRGNSTLNGGMIRIETSDGTSGVARFYAGSGSTVLESNSNTPLIFGTNATERMRIDASGNITTTGTATFGGNVTIPAASYLYFDGGGDTFMREPSPNIVQVNTAGSLAMTIDATQNVIIEGYVYPNSGIYLGGTVAANLLDDYEEGTYTAAITCGTSGTVTLQAAFDTAAYTKIGDLVSVQGLLIVDSVSSPVGYFAISLPFGPRSLTDRAGDSSGSIFVDYSTANVRDFCMFVSEVDGAFAYVFLGDSTSRQSDSANALAASTQITFQISYKAA